MKTYVHPELGIAVEDYPINELTRWDEVVEDQGNGEELMAPFCTYLLANWHVLLEIGERYANGETDVIEKLYKPETAEEKQKKPKKKVRTPRPNRA